MEVPQEVDEQVNCYSNYKKNTTVKFLVGIIPSGMIVFITKAYGGRSMDTIITTVSKLAHLLELGDMVLGDKVFL